MNNYMMEDFLIKWQSCYCAGSPMSKEIRREYTNIFTSCREAMINGRLNNDDALYNKGKIFRVQSGTELTTDDGLYYSFF